MSFQGNTGMAGGAQASYGNPNPGGMANQYNPSMMQMTPYGLSQSQPPQQQQGYMSGGYGQSSMMGSTNMGSSGGLAGPGEMLQIQAAPGYSHPYPQQQSGSQDPFSAFDGL